MNRIEFAALAAVAAFLAGPAAAQTADDNQPDMAVPPRLAVVEGNVQFWRPSAEGWEPAALNAALAEGDSIQAGSDATVELQIGPRDFARLRADTLLTLAALDPGLIHFRLESGTASFDLRAGRSGQLVRIDSDNANIVVGGRGYYRISVGADETRLTVRNQGRATLTLADGSSRSVGAGEEIVVSAAGARVDSHAAPPLDSWDRWNDARSDYYAAAVSNRYVPDDAYGAADLDQYGRWREDSSYGWIWLPAVSSGWAPYSTGEWRWDPYYGWTWVDQAPWGWTTCHYGRWVHVGGAWAWAPGPRRARVVYAPALVAFFQIDGGMSWVALGWGEPLVPWWGRPGFRGAAWWAGWGGPRVTYHHERHSYRNRSIATAVISVREAEFGRQRIRGSSMTPAPEVALRPILGDHPVRFAGERAVRRDALPSRPRPEPLQRLERAREGVPRVSGRGEPVMRLEEPRVQRESRSVEPRIVAPAAPAPVPAPAEPVIRPRVIAPPEMRREVPVQREMRREMPREMQREWRHEERVIQRSQPRPLDVPRMEMRRVEPPRAEMPRPQLPHPAAPEIQRRGGEREHGLRRPKLPGERD